MFKAVGWNKNLNEFPEISQPQMQEDKLVQTLLNSRQGLQESPSSLGMPLLILSRGSPNFEPINTKVKQFLKNNSVVSGFIENMYHLDLYYFRGVISLDVKSF